MARPRTPKTIAEITGRAGRWRSKFEARKEPKPAGPLGDPPEWLVDSETIKARTAWLLFEREMPWLSESHRMLVGMAAILQGRFMAGQDIGVQAMNLLRLILGQIGATPADAGKIAAPHDDSRDELLDG